jgi:hypothetical protein
VKTLEEMGLLIPQTLTVKNSETGENHDVSGFYVVDREKLSELSDDKFLELRKSGALECIHNHIMSLESLDKLLRKKNIRPPAQTVASQIEAGKSAAAADPSDA